MSPLLPKIDIYSFTTNISMLSNVLLLVYLGKIEL